MDKFEEYIKARYPVDYDHLKEKYPNVPVGEFYGDEKDLWNYRQAEVDELQEEYAETELYLRGQLTDRDSKIANLEYLLEQDKSLIPILDKKLEEKDKRIEELESRLKAVHALARMRSAVINADRWFTLRPHIKNAIKCLDRKEKALRGEHEA